MRSGGHFFLLQRSEQYFTCSQHRAHFFRQANGLPQVEQVLEGRGFFMLTF